MVKNPANANLDNMLILAEDELAEVIHTASLKNNQHPDLADWMVIHLRCLEVLSRLENVRKAFADYDFSHYTPHSLKDLSDKESSDKYYAVNLRSGKTVFRSSEDLCSTDKVVWYCPNCIRTGLASPLRPDGNCFAVRRLVCEYCAFTVPADDL